MKRSSGITKFLLVVIVSGALIVYYYFAASSKKLHSFAEIICEICIISVLIFTGKYIFAKIKKKSPPIAGEIIKETLDDRAPWFYCGIACCLLLTAFTGPEFQSIIDFHKLELEPTGGIYTYYVTAENASGREYTLPASVCIAYDYYEESHYNPATLNDEERTVYESSFVIRKVYFENGGYLYFEDPIVIKKANKREFGYDQNGRGWDITLTDKYVQYSDYFEYSPITLENYCTWILSMLATIIQLFLWGKSHIQNTYADDRTDTPRVVI